MAPVQTGFPGISQDVEITGRRAKALGDLLKVQYSTLLNQHAVVVAELDSILNAKPVTMASNTGKSACRNHLTCNHPGCEVLRNIQASVRRALEEIRHIGPSGLFSSVIVSEVDE